MHVTRRIIEKGSSLMFSNQIQAKRYFIDKIILQARQENIQLSEAEKYMLGWTETEEGFVINKQLLDRFNQETTNEKFEKKITGLLKHVYKSEANNDPASKETYRDAYRVLSAGYHYILVMIRSAIGTKLNNRFKDRLLLILAAIAVFFLILRIQYMLSYFGIKK